MGPQYWETVYISEFNGGRKVESDAQVAEQELRPMQLQLQRSVKSFYKVDVWKSEQLFTDSGNIM